MKHLIVLFALLFAVTVSAQAQNAIPLVGVDVKVVSSRSDEIFARGKTDASGKLLIEVRVDSIIYSCILKFPDTLVAIRGKDGVTLSYNINTLPVTMDFTLADMDGNLSHKVITLNDVRNEGMLDLSGGKIETGHFGKIVDVTVTTSGK